MSMYDKYQKPLEEYEVRRCDWEKSLLGDCKVAGPYPKRPERFTYFVGEPTERLLSDVLLQTMKSEHLVIAPHEMTALLLEMAEVLPKGWVKEALDARMVQGVEKADGQAIGADSDLTDNSVGKDGVQ